MLLHILLMQHLQVTEHCFDLSDSYIARQSRASRLLADARYIPV